MTLREALVTWRRGNRAAALSAVQALLESQPSQEVRLALADMRSEMGDWLRAIGLYEEALGHSPGDWRSRLGMARCLRSKPLSVSLLKRPRYLLEALDCQELEVEMLGQACAVQLLNNPRLEPLWRGQDPLAAELGDELLLKCLPLVIMADLRIEQGLTRLRAAVAGRVTEYLPLVAALARQCYLNEYAWWAGPDELDRLAGSDPDQLEGALLRGLYGGLQKRPSGNWPELDSVWRELLDQPQLERQLAGQIPSLRPIQDGVSQAVSALYEENPYPRWRGLSHQMPLEPATLLRSSFPHFDPGPALKQPRVLAAGCGTGRDLLTVAQGWQCATLTGVDLSRTSLAYAHMMAERLGQARVEWLHADLLELSDWERRFDVIFCTGVLHHMADPLAGWKVLSQLLEPGGVMKIALYSQRGRDGLVAAQRWLAEHQYSLHEGRHRLQQLDPSHPARAATNTRDFYYVSGCRDLLQHVQEHRFSIPDIARAVQELGLNWVGFELDAATQAQYDTLFPDDPSRSNFYYWEKYEELHPQTFFAMYQFWCEKPAL